MAYPVSGTWTYENATESGPAKQCGRRIMKFAGLVRYDTETAAPEYRNLSVTQVNPTTWQIVDQVYTVVTSGKVYYTLRMIDDDHITIHLDKGGNLNAGGAQWTLRRCVS
ncbi:MAG: hypothetical protein ACXWKC_10385 [Xanthobacteraceae bacterium]